MIPAIVLIVFGAGFIFLSVIAPTSDISVTIHTEPPLSMVVDFNPYNGSLTIRGTNQDARPVEFLAGLALLILGIVFLKKSGQSPV